MPALELTEVLAWSLIAAGAVFAALQTRGMPAAAVTACLAALGVKTVLLNLS